MIEQAILRTRRPQTFENRPSDAFSGGSRPPQKQAIVVSPTELRKTGDIPSATIFTAKEVKAEPTSPFAIVWKGQGSQEVGMGKEFRGKWVTAIYRESHGVFGFPVRQVSLRGPEELLKFTIVTQPSIVTLNEVMLEVLRQESPEYFGMDPRFWAGLSLGEYSALRAAGALTRTDLFKIIRARSAAMQYASEMSPGGNVVMMVPGRIPDEEDPEKYETAFEEAAHEAEKVKGLTVGIYLAHGQRVFAGSHDKLDRLRGIAKRVGQGKYLQTSDVQASGPFHSDAMRYGIPLFKKNLAKIEIHKPRTKVILNTTAKATDDPKDIRQEMIDHLVKPVLWEQTQNLIYEQAEGAIEMGAARTLTNAMRRYLGKREVQAAIAGLSAAGVTAATLMTWRGHHKK